MQIQFVGRVVLVGYPIHFNLFVLLQQLQLFVGFPGLRGVVAGRSALVGPRLHGFAIQEVPLVSVHLEVVGVALNVIEYVVRTLGLDDNRRSLRKNE